MSEIEDIEKKGDRIERRYEEHALLKEKNKEEFRVIEEVFDRLTLQGILKLFKKEVIHEIHGVVNAGKEARVYWAIDSNRNELAVKIYYTHTAGFRKGIMKYIQGDPRFKKVKKNIRSIIYLWSQKEFSNLQLCEKAGVNAPRPIDFYRNILVMTFIGEDGVPAPLLRDVDLQDQRRFYFKILNEMQLLWQKGGIVHGDLSEYNLMVYKEKPVIFDVSQAMLTSHPIANILLDRDIQKINSYFGQLGVETRDPNKLREWVTSGKKEIH